jgi:hypothetical protein
VDVDPGLIPAAKAEIGRTHGLSPQQSARLVGSSAEELHRDARAMTKELGVVDPSEQGRDGRGRYTGEHADMNSLIRAVAGR